MKRITAVTLVLLLLAGCRAPAGEGPAPTEEPDPTSAVEQTPAPEPDWEEYINTYQYERYKDLVDGYFDARMAQYNAEMAETGSGCRYSDWKLTEFIGYRGTSKEEDVGVVLFRMNAAYRTDPPEDGVNMLANGAYVDSDLWIHTPSGRDGGSVYLMTVDGEAVGFFYGDRLIDAIDRIETVKQFQIRRQNG